METKRFNGKAIYQPGGKAAEYSKWACNFYVGCSNGCEYCYCKKGILAGVMGMDKPQLKKCFKNEQDAHDVFVREMLKNLDELYDNGLFFSFTTDPMLPETIGLTFKAINSLIVNGISVKILTKCTWWVDEFLSKNGILVCDNKAAKCHKVAFGFTLTGHDELETNASTNQERIEAMRKLHEAGFKTFASIEPIIDFESSYKMIIETLGFCDLYKIGLQSGRKYDKNEIHDYLSRILLMACSAHDRKVYFKDSLLKQAGIDRAHLPLNCVNSDYNLFQ